MSKEPPDVELWQEDINAGDSPASVSDRGGKSQPSLSEGSDGSYDGPESPAAPPMVEKPSYTDLVTIELGHFWLCPWCAMLMNSIPNQIASLKNCGYTELEYWVRDVPEVYNKKGNYKEMLFFRNPSGVTQCMNTLRGVRCEFNREAHEGFRRRQLEMDKDVGTPPYFPMGYCGGCMYYVDDVKRYPELQNFIHEEKKVTYEKDEHGYDKKRYADLNIHPYTGEAKWVYGRGLPWHDDKEGITCNPEESITCNTKGVYSDVCKWRYGMKPKVLMVDMEKENVTVTPRDLEPSASDVVVIANISSPDDTSSYESSSIYVPSNRGADRFHHPDSSD